MKCPNCNTELKMAERSGVEIDYCPQCRGVWLDKGELDKIIERSAEHYHGKDSDSHRKEEHREEKKYYDKDKDHYYDHDKKHHHYKKKRGFLGDLFDFD
ncbi:MAG: zf-TFIIB domain-containing protein [Bacteroidota bacterium]